MRFRASFLSAVPVVATLALAAVFSSTLEGQDKALLMNPQAFNDKAPPTFRAQFETTKGTFVVDVHRDWAPYGADRFYSLVKKGFYDGNRFFRVTPMMAVWGIHNDNLVAKRWLMADTKIPNDPERVHSNTKGTVAILQRGGRQTHTFINLIDNETLDFQITPFGEVVSGMDVVQRLYSGYGEAFPTGKGPTMNDILEKGDAYIAKEFPMMDQIKKASIVP